MLQTEATTLPSPFATGAQEKFFFPGRSQIEALARLEYLVQERHRIGLLISQAGSGKSALLQEFLLRCESARHSVVRLNLMGLAAEEFPWLLADGLGLRPRRDATSVKLWQAVADHLRACCYQRRRVVTLLDEADRAAVPLFNSVVRLLYLDTKSADTLTIVLTASTDGCENIPHHLRQQVALRIELPPWDCDEVRQFLTEFTVRDGAGVIFERDAADRIYQVSAGFPKRVAQLAAFSTMVAISQNKNKVDVATIEAAQGDHAIAG